VDTGTGTLERVVWDYNLPIPNRPVYPGDAIPVLVKLALQTLSGMTSWHAEDGFTAIQGVTLNPGETLKYHLRFDLSYPDLSSILLAAPYMDDVTIYYRVSEVELLGYYVDTQVL
jgi:hypothetical protein